MSLFYRGYNNEGKKKSSPFIIGRVKEIVLSNSNLVDAPITTRKDIGRIKFEVMFSSLNQSFSDSTTNFAYPIFSSIKQYPLINEFVYIIPGPDSDLNDNIDSQGFYYFPPFSIWNFPNHGVFPNMEELAKFYQSQYSKPNYNNNLPKVKAPPPIPMGETFSETQDVRGLKPFEGDTIIEGRFGQSIRFGSTNIDKTNKGVYINAWSQLPPENSPITIIRNGQGKREDADFQSLITEDIYYDPSSIWLTSNQYITISGSNEYPLGSYAQVKYNKPVPNTTSVNRIPNPPADIRSPKEIDGGR